MPVSCHFQYWKVPLVTSLTHASRATASVRPLHINISLTRRQRVSTQMTWCYGQQTRYQLTSFWNFRFSAFSSSSDFSRVSAAVLNLFTWFSSRTTCKQASQILLCTVLCSREEAFVCIPHQFSGICVPAVGAVLCTLPMLAISWQLFHVITVAVKMRPEMCMNLCHKCYFLSPDTFWCRLHPHHRHACSTTASVKHKKHPSGQ